TMLLGPCPVLQGCSTLGQGRSHTVQRMYGCDLLEDGSIRGFDQYGYEGTDFLALDEDMLTYTAADAAAQITKRKWEEDETLAERRKYYLENTCIDWLRKYMSYGKDVLERRGEAEGDAAPGCKQEQGQCRELSLAEARRGPGAADPEEQHRAQQ
uniref:MHC class I-like antigen recognition-like domain-containing protein n=1 Tax=Anas zonorhyncha TaxID=75864 RepID=A0A8B9UM41_9AVES